MYVVYTQMQRYICTHNTRIVSESIMTESIMRKRNEAKKSSETEKEEEEE